MNVDSLVLDPSDGRELLRIARVTLKESLKNRRMPPGSPHRAALLAPTAAHVALRIAGAPYGSAHALEPETPLFRTVGLLAIRISKETPPAPMSIDQLIETRIRIAVLSPRTPLRNPDEIEPGRHGILVRQGEDLGLLLPDSQTQQGVPVQTLLGQACQAGGLAQEAWQASDARLEIFTADIYTDPD